MSSAASRRSRSHSTTASPTNPSSKRSFSATTSPRITVNRGKRARRDSTSSSRPPSLIIPVASPFSVPFSGLLTAKPLTAIPSNLTSSAPPTPLFPSTSAAFFPSSASSERHIQRDTVMDLAPRTSRRLDSNVDDLHREAFTSLRQSVAESGEGFVRRMQEWEQRRHADSSKLHMLGNDKERDKRRDRGRGHRGRATRPEQRIPQGYSTYNVESRRLPVHQHLDGQEETDDEDDIMLDGSTQVTFGVQQLKKPTDSLEDLMDVIDSPELFDVEIADSDGEAYPASRFSTFDFPFTYSNTRSSSPFSLNNTSDDESSYAHTNSGFSSPLGINKSSDWSRNPSSPSHSKFHSLHLVEGAEYYQSESSPTLASPRLLRPHPIPSRALSISQLIPATTSGTPHPRSHRSPQTASEKAVAALTLALANGSGSLADYGSVREAQGNLEELEAGALWD